MGFLIDTSIFVAWERGELDLATVLASVADEPVFLSVVSASELLHGVHRADTVQRRSRRERFVETVLAAVEVVPIDLMVARRHAMVWADLAARGELIGAHDLWIAATAVTRDLKLATRNEREFGHVEDLEVVRW